MKTAVCPALVPTVEHALLCLVAASPVHVLQGSQAFAASMTQMNVRPHTPYVKMKDNASTPLVPTSKLLFCFLDFFPHLTKIFLMYVCFLLRLMEIKMY